MSGASIECETFGFVRVLYRLRSYVCYEFERGLDFILVVSPLPATLEYENIRRPNNIRNKRQPNRSRANIVFEIFVVRRGPTLTASSNT